MLRQSWGRGVCLLVVTSLWMRLACSINLWLLGLSYCRAKLRTWSRGDIKASEITRSVWINSSAPPLSLSLPITGYITITSPVRPISSAPPPPLRQESGGSVWFESVNKMLNHDFFFSSSKGVRVAHSQSFAPHQALGIPQPEEWKEAPVYKRRGGDQWKLFNSSSRSFSHVTNGW